ncbi:MAG TPA: AbrB/MazE/SpoVT family DNA-binding domain-containing protein [Terrimicrobiaceae bacterium]|nr:AbrB/MazE/SpoVT family DNA-binding domain-containing protein [Terrimicrobiaceae bacterium]
MHIGGETSSGLKEVLLTVLTKDSYITAMKALVTSKGQVTIPKELRDRFGIEPGAEVDFAISEDGIRLRKVVDRRKQRRVLGCLKTELEGRAVTDLLESFVVRLNCQNDD